MPISPKDEDIIIQWLFGEIIYNKNQGQSISRSSQMRWATNTRFQKILFNIAEEQNIPITRSWYMWGGYVHTSLLDQDRFRSHTLRFSRDPRSVERLRTQIRDLDLDLEEIVNELVKQTEYFTSMDSKTILPIYYAEKTPSDYKLLYLSKQTLNDIFYMISNNRKYDIDHFYSFENSYHKNIYDFYESSLKIIDREDINEIKDSFYSIVNTALDKLEVYIIKNLEIDSKILSYFVEVYNCYKEHIWKPFASKVSQNTLTGFRATEESKLMAEREFYSIEIGKENIRNLGFKLERENIEPTYQEYKLLSNQTKIDVKVKQALGDLFSIYQQCDEDHE